MRNSHKRSPKFKLKAKIILAVISPILFFGLLEIGLRCFSVYIRITPQMRRAIQNNIKSLQMQKDPILFWKLRPGWEGVNSKRFRGKEFSLEKDPDVFRIFNLGDSSTWGSCVATEETYNFRLEKILNKTYSSKRFECINAGVHGYSSLQCLRYLKRDILKYKPDLITAYCNPQDSAVDQFDMYRPQITNPKLIYLNNLLEQKSKLYKLLVRIIYSLSKKKLLPGFRLGCAETYKRPDEGPKTNLEMMANIAKEYGFVMFIVKKAYNRNGELEVTYNSRNREAWQWEAPLVDTYKAFEKSGHRPEDLFADFAHPSPLGHQLIAEEIHRTMIKEGIIK